MSQLHISWQTCADSLVRLYPQWQNLFQHQPVTTGLFASPDFIQNYWAFYKPTDSGVLTVTEAHNGRLLAAIALQIFHLEHNGRQYRCARPVGANYAPFFEWPFASENRREVINAVLNQGMQAILRLDVAFMGPLHEGSILYQLLEDFTGSESLKIWRFPRNLHEIDTRGRNFEAYQRLCSSKAFKAARYAERKLAREKGPLSWHAPATPSIAYDVVQTLCEQELTHFGTQHVHNHHPEWPSFMAAFVRDLQYGAQADVQQLYVDGHLALTSLALRHQQRLYYMVSRPHPDYVTYSVDRILQARLITQSFERQEIFCFGAGDYAYKRYWAPTVGELKCALIFFNVHTRRALDPLLEPKSFARCVAF
ncbi:GNAT family N-acetyltransferase [Allopseudospirillum japonicum]|nr:GNAT family N-acetyltransferase [Allopseudospirillum japonicum]